ncbi:MAG: hypothetical protein JOZ81_27305 [Chloroflexi bacterium]|nr:hypothetical protein [Chloroflexota bacterium]
MIVVTDTGLSFYSDPNQPELDGVGGDDSLVGVLNNASKPLQGITIQAGLPVFAFDGDGLCTYAHCTYGPTGYEGPGTSFSTISADKTSGTVNFSTALPPGGTAYFSLQGNLIYTAAPAPPADVQVLKQPLRLEDTRSDLGPIRNGSSRCYTAAGVDGVPTDASAVLVNVTAVSQTTDGWLTAYPAGQSIPPTSTVNFGTSEYSMANGAVVRVGTNGQICVAVGTAGSIPGSSNVVLDITGYLTSAATSDMPMLQSPARLVDTRSNGGAISAGHSQCFPVAGVQGIPSNAQAIIMNVTATGYPVNGWLTAYPGGNQPVPATSTVNFDTHQYADANNAIMRIGSDGTVCVNVGSINGVPGSSQVILDAIGYVAANAPTGMTMLTSPVRVADTRNGVGAAAQGSTTCFAVAGTNGIPSNAVGAVINLTGVGYAKPGWLTAFPSGQSLPATSTLNFDISEYAVANGAIMALGPDGKLCVNVGTVNNMPTTSQIVLDVVGYLVH